MRVKIIALLALSLLAAGIADARIFKVTFQGVTPDMPYPAAEYYIYRANNTAYSYSRFLTTSELQTLAYRDGSNYTVTSEDSYCDSCSGFFGCTATCNSYATAEIITYFSVYSFSKQSIVREHLCNMGSQWYS